MRLVTYERNGSGGRTGVLNAEGNVIDLVKAAQLLELCPERGPEQLFGSMQKLIEAGPEALDSAGEILQRSPDEAVTRAEDARLLAPLPRPQQLRCFSTFEKHGRQSVAAMMKTIARQSDDPDKTLQELKASGRFEIPDVVYQRPFYYKGNRMSVVGTDTDIQWPAYSELIDYELELAVVIGKQGVNVSAAKAHDHFFGYTVCNDLSARDAQMQDLKLPLGPAKGKDFDGGIVLGPCIVTCDELTDPYSLEMTARVNGEEWGKGRSDDMLFSFEQLLEFVSQSETIYPGEIFLSGCVGNGSGMELGRFPQHNDVIELEIDGIGRICNRII